MAFKDFQNVNKGVNEKIMTMKQFIEWIKQYDEDKDGRISRDELEDAIRANGGWFCGWKGKRGVKAADENGDGFIEENEIRGLVEFAQKQFGIRVVPN